MHTSFEFLEQSSFCFLCRTSASCVHVSSLLHDLVVVTANNIQLHPSLPSTSVADKEEETMPTTSFFCQWKVPKKRKESNQPISAITFEKHDYQKEKKSRLSLTKDFDPYPSECKGTAQNLLDSFLENVCGESLGVSVLFDPVYCHKDVHVYITFSSRCSNCY